MRVLHAFDRIIARVEQTLLFFMLTLIVGVNLMQIGIRLLQSLLRVLGSEVVLHAPSWPADVNRVLVLWIAIVGGSLATRRNEHIKVDFLSRLIAGRLRNLVNRCIFLAGMIVSCLLAVFSQDFLKMEYELRETLVALPVPLWCIQLIIPAGFLVIAYRFFLLFLEGGRTLVHTAEEGASSYTESE